ncbi:hypothetical protein THF5H11_20161 [Vibrio jasicida]|nr:hypothetical protein THF5H11_20161 [Vibrio jasicida]CAH1608446.1 hypothetical protein THF5G08_60166 [Vibrio jasicida]
MLSDWRKELLEKCCAQLSVDHLSAAVLFFISWKGSETLLSTQVGENLALYSAGLYHSSVGTIAAP